MKLMATSDICLFPFKIKRGSIVTLIGIQIGKASTPIYDGVSRYDGCLYDVECSGVKISGLNSNDFVVSFDEINGWNELSSSMDHYELRELDRVYYNHGRDAVEKVIKELVMSRACI